MKKSADAFRSIGEVAKLVGVAPHVLRYWETQFPLLSPVKRRDGRRYYRPEDVKLVAGLCAALREEGLSIRGAKKQMAEDRGAALRACGAGRLPELFGAPEKPFAPAKPKPRKAATEPLPLFPDLTPAPPPKPAPAPKPAPPAPAWLDRLCALRSDVARLEGAPPELASLYQRLVEARAHLLG